MLLLLICLAVPSFASKSEEVMFELMSEGNTFEQSNVSGILKLIKTDAKDTWVLYQNLRRFTPFTVQQRGKVLDMILSLTEDEAKRVNTDSLLDLVSQSMPRLVDASEVVKLKILLKKLFADSSVLALASIILNYNSEDIETLEVIKKIAQKNNFISATAANDLLKTIYADWAKNKLEELALHPELKNTVLYKIVHHQFNTEPWPQLIHNITSKGMPTHEINMFLFNIESLYPSAHKAFLESIGCKNLIKRVS